MKLTALLFACALGLFLTGCTAEVEMSTDTNQATHDDDGGAAHAAGDVDGDDHSHDGDDHDEDH